MVRLKKSNVTLIDKFIYITNDEKIKINDWVLHKESILEVSKLIENTDGATYLKVKELSNINIRVDVCQKIIASSNPDLNLPQIPTFDYRGISTIMVEYDNRCCGRCDGIHDLNLKPQEPPIFLYHGTAESSVPFILKEGLKPQKRNHVHLS